MDYGCYADLDLLKARLKRGGFDEAIDNAVLKALLEAASRAIDRYCKRHFYVKTETKYFDGGAYTQPTIDRYTGQVVEYASRLVVPDLLSITTLKFDSDQDAVYEYTLAATDYILYPYVDFPKTRVDLDLRQGDYYYYPVGQKPIEIAGVWGYGNGQGTTPYEDSGATITVANGTATTVSISDQSLLAVGQTVLVESEQIYIRQLIDDPAGDTGLVWRGINGTTGAAHSAKAAYIYRYPEEVTEAVILTASRLWVRKDSSYATVIASAEIGELEIYRGLDPDVKRFLQPYIRMRRKTMAV